MAWQSHNSPGWEGPLYLIDEEAEGPGSGYLPACFQKGWRIAALAPLLEVEHSLTLPLWTAKPGGFP